MAMLGTNIAAQGAAEAYRFPMIVAFQILHSSVTIPDGASQQLRSQVATSPPNQNVPVTWSSSNRSVVTVSSGGRITARSPGTATITMRVTAEPGISSSVRVTVLPTIFSTYFPASTASWLLFFFGFGWIWMWFVDFRY